MRAIPMAVPAKECSPAGNGGAWSVGFVQVGFRIATM
jgi:hypothetical protein